MVIVVTPRPAGQPKTCSMATNISSRDKPVITSGITSGAVVMPVISVRPLKRRKRDSAKPASVPRMTAPVALIEAMRSDSLIWSLCSSSRYHLVEKPAHTVTSRDSLNEYTIIDRIGM